VTDFRIGAGAITRLAVMASLVLLLNSCAATQARASGSMLVATATASPSHRGSVSIPEGAGGDLAKKQPVLFLKVKALDSCKEARYKLSEQTIKLVNSEVEAQIARMKRFSVYSIYNKGGQDLAREMGDLGLAREMDTGQLPSPDAILNVEAMINTEENFDKTQAEKLVVCTATVVYNLTDSTGKILSDTQHASGTIRTPKPEGNQKLEDMKNVRRIVQRYDAVTDEWKEVGGFDPRNPEVANALVKQTIEEPLKGLVGRLALALPVTTQVTGLNASKTTFAIRAGQKNGVFKGTKVVVWCEQGDFTYPIASTVAEPVMDKSNLKIVSWNDADPDAKEIIAKIKSGGIPDDLKDKIWATTEGIPLEEMLAP